MPTGVLFFIVALVFSAAGKVWLHASPLWSVCFGLTSAGGMVLTFRSVSRFFSGPRKLDRLVTGKASPAEIVRWLSARLVSAAPEDAAVPAVLLAVPIVMLCFKVIPWAASTPIVRLIRFAAYAGIGIVPTALVSGWVKRAQDDLHEAVGSDPEVSAIWRAHEAERTEELIAELLDMTKLVNEPAVVKNLKPFAKRALVRLRDLLRTSDEPQKRRLGRAFLGIMGRRPEENVDDMTTLTEALVEIVKTEEVSLQIEAMRKLRKLDPDWDWTSASARQELVPPLIRAFFALRSLTPQENMQQTNLLGYLDSLDKDWRRSESFKQVLARKLAPAPPARSSIGEALAASLLKIHQEVQARFAECLGQLIPQVRDPLALRDAEAPPSDLTWDNSEELRQAAELTHQPSTRAEGTERLRKLIEGSPASAAPYGLLAQALGYDDRYDDAERALVEALPQVCSRSEILDSLGNMFSGKPDYLKATAYYFTAAYAMNPHSANWGTLVYLSGVYRACGNDDRSGECHEAAAAMRGGNPAELARERFAALRQAVESHRILVDLADSAWPSICDNIGRLSGKLGKETWKPGPPPAQQGLAKAKQEGQEMLKEFRDGLDALLRSCQDRLMPQLSSLDLSKAPFEEKLKLAMSLAQQDSQVRIRLLALLELVQGKADSLLESLNKEPKA